MRWFILACLTLAMLLAVHVGTVSACINDTESLQSEKEFKSTYIEKAPPAPQYQPEPTGDNNLMVLGGSGVGVALLVGACVLGIVRTRRD
jgi:hypothetical protein